MDWANIISGEVVRLLLAVFATGVVAVIGTLLWGRGGRKGFVRRLERVEDRHAPYMIQYVEAQTAREEAKKIQSDVKQRFLSLEEDRRRAERRTDDLYSALINMKMNTYMGSAPAPQMLDGDVTRILTMSQAEYDALPEKDGGTMYLVPELKRR